MFRLELENPFIKNQQTPVASSRIWKNGKRHVRLSQIQILVDAGYGEKTTIYILFSKNHMNWRSGTKNESHHDDSHYKSRQIGQKSDF